LIGQSQLADVPHHVENENLMQKQHLQFNVRLLIFLFFLMLLLTGCAPSLQSCPQQEQADLSQALAYAEDDQLEFRFPLDELSEDVQPFPALFCSYSCGPTKCEYHAAEDYFLPAGTPVYAIADGDISFSGRMGGYGWLIIIDHPQANIYSLYGHLSPSRWRLDSGPVEKGDLIAYLGDPDENGGSAENPLRPHLHFGIRAGQRTDYPGMGEWRWMGGWIKPCPQDLGWLNPSEVITSQDIPSGGFPEPNANVFEKWGVELIMIGVYLIGGTSMLIFALNKKNFIVPAISGGLMIVAGWVFTAKGTRISYVVFPLAAFMIGCAIFLYIRYAGKNADLDQDKINS